MLTSVASAAGKPVLTLSPAARVRIADDESVLHHCPQCGQGIIEGDPHLSRLIDIVLVCPSCTALLYTRPLRAGEPVPNEANIYSPTVYDYSHGLQLDATTCCVSSAALAEYRNLLRPTNVIPDRLRPDQSVKTLIHVLDEVTDRQVSKNVEQIRRSLDEGRSVKRQSRLLRCMVEVPRHTQRTIYPSERLILSMIADISVVIYLVKRWYRHPSFPSIACGLLNEWPHSVYLLQAATVMFDNGTGISFLESNEVKTPDFVVIQNTAARIFFETKAPDRLQHEEAQYNPATAVKVAADVLLKAIRRSSGQISSERPGFLVIGTRTPDQVLVRQLVVAAHDFERKQGRLRPHRTGFVVISRRGYFMEETLFPFLYHGDEYDWVNVLNPSSPYVVEEDGENKLVINRRIMVPR